MLIPLMEDIPEEFKVGNTKWNIISNDWFFNGLKNVQFLPKDGVDPEDAIRHISAIMSSFKPSHQHKEAACAYLISNFFEDVKYE